MVSYCLMGIRFVLQDEKSSADWLHNNLNLPLNCTFKNDQDTKFYFMHILPQFFLKKEKIKMMTTNSSSGLLVQCFC